MKNKKFHFLTTISLTFCILTGITFPILFTFIDVNNSSLDNKQNSDDMFVTSVNGKDYLAKYLTAEDIDVMKKNIQTAQTRLDSESNPIVDGHGTGFSVPTSEYLDTLVGKLTLVDVISESGQRYQATADLSSEIYFPVVGDQGTQGSCSAWANAYYAYGYLEAKDNGWDASSGNPDYLLSPAWAYNIVAAYDYGSVPYEVSQVLLDWGVPTFSAMPYDDSDVNSWGDETAWRQAPYHRPLDYTLITYTGTATIDLIKSLIDGGTPFTIGIDAYQFSNGLNQGTMDFILSSDEYDSASLNHAQCLVGYDDDVSEGTDVGAFRVVNSWGDSWMDSGYYWLTYDAFAEFAGISGQVLMYITDRIDYNPDIIATWEFSTSPTRMYNILTLGVGPHDSPFNTITPSYDTDTTNLFPDFMALDISSFYPNYTDNNDVMFFLDVGSSTTSGTISSFKLERYSGGVLQEISQESPNVPQITPGYVNATFMDINHELRVILEVPSDPIIFNPYSIKAMVMNNGILDETGVYFELLLNSVVVDFMTIPSLLSGANETIDYSWTPTTYDMYNFTAQTPPISGEIFSSNNIATVILPILGPIFQDDFESGLSKWTSITGMWHLTNASSSWSNPYHTPTHSMWFGNESTGNYDTGFREMGNLTSTPIDLTSSDAAFLEFYHWRATEGASYDISFVYISVDGVNWDQIYINQLDNVAPWEKIRIDITPYTGNPSVQIRFYFDTIDDMFNEYRGWLVDDVMVLGTVDIPHDLRVSLQVPENPEIGNTYEINATVTNIGSSDETNVDFSLYLNGGVIVTAMIGVLPSGTSHIIHYDWTLIDYGGYNFTAYAPPVTGETIKSNNLVTEFLNIREIILSNGMFIKHIFDLYPNPIGFSNISYSSISATKYHATMDLDIDGMIYTSYWDVDSQTRIMENTGGSGLTFTPGIYTPFWIFTDTSLGEIIPIAVDGEGDHNFYVANEFLKELPGFGLVEVWELQDLTTPGGVAWYEKSTGILLNSSFLFSGGIAYYTHEFLDSNAPFEYIVFDHDLTVYLETPDALFDYGDSYLISATVKNNGLFTETNVELFLYLDGSLVNSVMIPTLNVGMEQSIQYTWITNDYGSYNFTAFATPVPLESYIQNNIKTTFVYILNTKLFNGLNMTYNFDIYIATFSYAPYTGSLFTESLDIPGYISYNWKVDALTRIMSGGSLFGDGFHTLAWIFTNISLYDLVPIAVDGEGDHIFNVTKDLIYDLPGFGPVAVWELEDLTMPGGIVWYEKSTGILLNGTFLYSSGSYEFDFIDTNAELTIVAPPDPFILSSTADDPDDDGNFNLLWTESLRADNYTVYQYPTLINSINGSLTLLADEIEELSLDISDYDNGTYYFIIVSHNVYGDTLSNCLEITVEYLPPGDFTLSSNAGNPDTDGNFDLIWTASSGALSYSIYSSSNYITAINGTLTLLEGGITELEMALSGENGIYYFIVVASNNNGETLSNCIKITVLKTAIPGYNMLLLIIALGAVSSLLLKKKFKTLT